MMRLALPVLAENLLHILVGVNDTWLANHIHLYTPAAQLAPITARAQEAAATAAVGTITYVLWFIGLLVGAVGTGSTAIIARATGARHRRLANSICGQSVSAACMTGIAVGGAMIVFASAIAAATGLHGDAHDFALSYVRMLGISLPLFMLMFVANACLRGAGDTLTPAIAMIVVDIVNLAFSFGLTYGWAGLPKLGFDGIAAGTVIAYCAGGVLQAVVLLHGRGGIRLYVHRLRPHWHHLKRLLRIGVPAGIGDALQWLSNFFVLRWINGMDATNVAAAAHTNAVRIESFSYMTGLALATAAATLVGQSLGMNDPKRAARSGWLTYAIGGGCMTGFGLFFILFGRIPARLMSNDTAVVELTTRCLMITGFIQPLFAAVCVFSGALRGAGDTMKVMLLTLSSILTIRLLGAYCIVRVFHLSLPYVWVILASDLAVRGILLILRFRFGGWRHLKV